MRRRTIVSVANPPTQPVVGDLMIGPGGVARFSIVSVVRLRHAGNPQLTTYRLQFVPAEPCDVQRTTHPWRLAPPQRRVRRDAMSPDVLHSPQLASLGVTDRAMLERIRAKAPLLFAMAFDEPRARARIETDKARLAQARRVGRDVGVVNMADLGHSIRMAPVFDEAGQVLRAADVEVQISPQANRPYRRARRVDPLSHIGISKRQFEAAARLRSDLEGGMPAIGGASQSAIHAAPWDRSGISERQLHACEAVRGAMEPVPRAHRLVLTWMIGGGSISGYVHFARVARETALASLKAALDIVANYYRPIESE